MEVGIEGAIGAITKGDAASDLARQIIDFKFRDAASTAVTGNKTLPGLFDTASKRRHQTKTGDDDTPHIHPLNLINFVGDIPQAKNASYGRCSILITGTVPGCNLQQPQPAIGI